MIQVTPSNVAAILKAPIVDGETLVFVGTFSSLLLKDRPWAKGVTFDLTSASLAGLNLSKVHNLSLKNGLLTGTGIAAWDAAGLTLQGVEGRGDGTGNYLSVHGGANVSVYDARVDHFKNGVVLERVNTFDVEGLTFTNMTVDCISGAGSSYGAIARCKFSGTNSPDGAHPDCIQWRGFKGEPSPRDITITDCYMEGFAQGVFFGDHGEGGFDRVTVRGMRVNVGFPNALAFAAVRGLTLENNYATTWPGGQFQAKIFIGDNCSDVKLSGFNRFAGFNGKPPGNLS